MYKPFQKTFSAGVRGRLMLMAILLSIFGSGTFTTLAYTVKGKVVDEENAPMFQASVKILSPADSTKLYSAATSDKGTFSISNVRAGKYILATSFMGYDTKYLDFTVKNSNLTLPTVQMEEGSLTLGSVTVTGIRPAITVKEDTIEFTADSYKTAPNAVVEDVLKRLPGVEVGSDGKITSNGKEVTKILVDGKEFFADDPKVASKNLPADMIDKVQVVDRKSDLARLTGVDDGEEETVINLTVKKGMQNGWFGSAGAGLGTDSRYKGFFNINRFWNGNQITFLGNLNNINELGFTDGTSGRFMRFGGDNGITTSRNFGINFNVGNEEIFRLGGNVMYSNSKRRSWERSAEEKFNSDEISTENSERTSEDKGHNFRADFRMKWNPDSATTLEFTPNFSFNSNKSWSDEWSEAFGPAPEMAKINRSINKDSSKGTSYSAGGRLIFNRKLNKPGRSLSFMANYRFSDTREKSNTYSWNRFFQLEDEEAMEALDQYIDNHTWTNSISSRLTWTEPLGNPGKGNYLTLAYNFSYRWNNADKLTYDRPISFPEGIDGEPVIGTDLDFNQDLSNRFRNDYMSQDIRFGFKHVDRKINFEGGLSLVPQMSKSHNLLDDAKNIPARHVFNFAPYLRLRFKKSKTTSANINYRANSSQPSMTQLQPVADMSDPLRIIIGNPDLKPSFTHRIMLRYQSFGQESQRSIMAMANISMTQNSIVSKTVYDGQTGGSTTTYENVNGVWSAMGMNMISFPLKNKQFSVSNHIMFRYNRSVGFSSSIKNKVDDYNLRESLGFAWRPENASFEIRPYYSMQYSHNSYGRVSNSTIHSFGTNFNATYYTPFGLVISTDMDYSNSTGYSQGYNSEQWLWNASLSYQFLRDRNATISLSAYDILGKKTNISRTVTAEYSLDRMFNTLTRYFMVTLSYKFNSFKKGEMPEDRNRPNFRHHEGGRPPMGPPPGGGGGRPPMH